MTHHPLICRLWLWMRDQTSWTNSTSIYLKHILHYISQISTDVSYYNLICLGPIYFSLISILHSMRSEILSSGLIIIDDWSRSKDISPKKEEAHVYESNCLLQIGTYQGRIIYSTFQIQKHILFTARLSCRKKLFYLHNMPKIYCLSCLQGIGVVSSQGTHKSE